MPGVAEALRWASVFSFVSLLFPVWKMEIGPLSWPHGAVRKIPRPVEAGTTWSESPQSCPTCLRHRWPNRGVAFSKENLGDEVHRSFQPLVPSFELWARKPYHILTPQGPSLPSPLLACFFRSSLLPSLLQGKPSPGRLTAAWGLGFSFVTEVGRAAVCPTYRGAPGLWEQGPGEETSREGLGGEPTLENSPLLK